MNTNFIQTLALEHTKNQTYLGLNISVTCNFHKAVNDLREKARRAFYIIKRNIQFDIPIRIWLKILESVTKPIALYGCEVCCLLTNQEFTKWDKHQTETLHTVFCKNILCVQRKTQNNTELGRHPLMIKIQKRAVKFYHHLKGNDSQTFHIKDITYSEMNLEMSPLTKLVLFTNTPHRALGQQHNQTQTNHEKKEDNYLTHWKEFTKKPEQTRMLFGPKQRGHSGRIPDHCD